MQYLNAVLTILLVSATICLALVTYMIAKINKGLLKRQEALTKINIISTISNTIITQPAYKSIEMRKPIFGAIFEAVPEQKNLIKKWFKECAEFFPPEE